MDTQKYWQRRELQLKQRQLKNAANYEYALESRLKELNRAVEREIRQWEGKYADTNGISQEEAQRILNGIETKHFELTLEEFEAKAKAGNDKKLLDSEYYKSRVAKAKQIKAQLERLGGQFANAETDQLRHAIESQYYDTYYHETWLNQQAQGTFSVDFSHFNEDELRQVAGKPWQGSDFSKRVWNEYRNELPSQLGDVMLRGVLLGSSYQKLEQGLRDRFKAVQKSSVHRLVITELGHAAEEATKQYYKDDKVTQYKYLATLESHTCDVCSHLDGKIFDVKDMKDGINYPLIHPYCRCTTIPYREDLPEIDSRWSRDPITGKGKIIGSMSYPDWVKRTNARVELLHKHRQHLEGTKYISSYQINKMLKSFVRKGGHVQMGKETDDHLRNVGASASTLDSNYVLISSWATKSAVYEELYHTRQLKHLGKSMGELSEQETINLEIDAQKYLLRNAKKMKLGYNEIEEIEENLKMWKNKAGRLK